VKPPGSAPLGVRESRNLEWSLSTTTTHLCRYALGGLCGVASHLTVAPAGQHPHPTPRTGEWLVFHFSSSIWHRPRVLNLTTPYICFLFWPPVIFSTLNGGRLGA
jgi:hypothetical protein